MRSGLAALVALVTAMLPSAASAARVASRGGQPAPAARVTAITCKDVFFLGARGSGESATSFGGMGHEVDDMAIDVRNFLNAVGITSFKPMAVGYSADRASQTPSTRPGACIGNVRTRC